MAMKVVGELGESMPIETAYCAATAGHRRGPPVIFRLVIGKTELPGLWLCVGRRFVPLGEAAEPL
jgi:hypothetical protein